MNSVHEPGSRTMSKNLTQEQYCVKPGKKQAECTKCTALASPRAQVEHPAPVPRAIRPPLRLLPRAFRVPAAAPAPRTPHLPTPAVPLPRACRTRARAPTSCIPRARPLRARSPAASPAPCRGLVGRVAALCCDTVL